MPVNRRDMVKLIGISTLLSSSISRRALAGVKLAALIPTRKIKLGLLWSSTGHLSLIEKPSLDVALFWIKQVNENGGIAGIQVEPVVVDAKSDIKTYREGILFLMNEARVMATFGGYTSASRRAVMPLVAKQNSIFYYPTCYEGRECWQNIICTGPIANQHSFDLIPFMVKKYGPRSFFVGSNYVWPIETNRIAKQLLNDAGGEIVGEKYVPLGDENFGVIIQEILNKKPDWIFSTVVGDSDILMRQQYVSAGLKSETMPIASLTTSELEIKKLGIQFGEGHILCAPYFQSLKNSKNLKFVEEFLNSEYGYSGVTHYNMEETYLSFQYFKKSFENTISTIKFLDIRAFDILQSSRGLNLTDDESPEGEVSLDKNNLNSWLKPKIGQFDSKGQLNLIWEREQQMAPMPYLVYPNRGSCEMDGLHLPSGRIIRDAS